MRAAIITPVELSAAYLARFTDDSDLPRYSGGSAPTLALSRPAQCSLTLRPARSADPLRGLSIEVLQIIRRLLIRSDRFRLEREFAGPDFHRGERCALPRHTEQSGREESIVRLVGAVLMEHNDDWQTQNRYMQIEGFAEPAEKTAYLKPLQITPKAA